MGRRPSGPAGAATCAARVLAWDIDCGDQYDDAMDDYYRRIEECKEKGQECIDLAFSGEKCPEDCDDFEKCTSRGFVNFSKNCVINR